MAINYNAAIPLNMFLQKRAGSISLTTQQNIDQLIKSLFANNEQGFAYDPNDLSAIFQDVAGTIPVTGAGQPVGLIKDKSGRGNHAMQTVSASRPILQRNATTGAYYLAFDGSDDFLVTNSINFTATDKISLFAGVRKLSDAVVGSIFTARTTGEYFEIYAPNAVNASNYVFATSVNSVLTYLTSPNNTPSPISNIITAKMDITNNTKTLSINRASNGGQVGSSGKLANYPLYIGRRGGTSLPFNGHIYGLIGVGRLSTDNETLAIEKELAKRVGVTLNV